MKITSYKKLKFLIHKLLKNEIIHKDLEEFKKLITKILEQQNYRQSRPTHGGKSNLINPTAILSIENNTNTPVKKTPPAKKTVKKNPVKKTPSNTNNNNNCLPPVDNNNTSLPPINNNNKCLPPVDNNNTSLPPNNNNNNSLPPNSYFLILAKARLVIAKV